MKEIILLGIPKINNSINYPYLNMKILLKTLDLMLENINKKISN